MRKSEQGRVMVAERKPDSGYRKMYSLGDEGSITRPENAAQVLPLKNK